MIGRVLGHYRIEEKIGAGGMGEVYRAHDQRLERDVAVKVLPAHTLDDQAVRNRFRKEALSLSRLNHPNIATVHDFDSQDGVDFLVMEYVPGTTLSDMLQDGPLPPEQVLDLASQLAAGLAAAHAQDLIHRDLKPGNLRITPDGRLKILDFGLAKLVPKLSDDAATMTMTMTESGAVMGTVPYMSPEQLLGGEVDARTDIYAAGAVLYEMTTGCPRYSGIRGAALIESILNRDPEPPSRLNPEMPKDMENVILKALARDPDQRYATTAALAEDLGRLRAGLAVTAPAEPAGTSRRWVAGLGGVAVLLVVLIALIALNVGGLRQRWFGGEAPLNTLAVLPMVNLSGDPGKDYLAEGMTRELITELTKISALQVRPFQSVMRYRGTEMTVPEIAKELGVAAVVMASVSSSGNQLHVNAQLIDASGNRNLWADSFDREMKNILGLYGQMARTIAAGVRVVVAPEEEARLADAKQVDPETYRLYLLGKQASDSWTKDGLTRGIEFNKRAIENESTYAPSYAAIANNYRMLAFGSMMDPREAGPLAKAAGARALELDPDLGAAHIAMAEIERDFNWDLDAAETEFQRALELNPGDISVLRAYSMASALNGRNDEAIEIAERGVALDPLNVPMATTVGWIYWWAGRFDEAIEQLNRVVEMNPKNPYPYMELSWCYAEKGMKREAVANIERALSLAPGIQDNQVLLARNGEIYARLGMQKEARSILKKLKQLSQSSYVDYFYVATIHISLGEYDEAIDLLRQGLEMRTCSVGFLKHARLIDPLRSDPRFQEIMKRAFGKA